MRDVTEQLERYGAAIESAVEEPRSEGSYGALPLVTDELHSGRRVPVLVTALAIGFFVVGALFLGLSGGEGGPAGAPDGPPTGPAVAHLRIESLPSLSYQATEFTTIAGVNEIEFVDKGGTHGLVFDDPALSYFQLEVPHGPKVGKVRLQAGRTYGIGDVIAGHRAAGMKAVIHVVPARFRAARDGGSVLPVPPRGSVEPARLSDGTPVFVVAHDHGPVGVLSAVSSHRPHGQEAAIGWCGRAQRFQDPYYGSTWDEYGLKVGGPAPSDLDAFESRLVENGTKVAVGRLLRPGSPGRVPRLGNRIGGPDPEPCVGAEGGARDFDPGDMQLIPFRDASASPFGVAIRRNFGRLVPVREITVLMARGERTRACATFDPSQPFRCAGPTVDGSDDTRFEGCDPASPAWAATSGPALVRFHRGSIVEVVFVREVKTVTEPADPCVSLLPQPEAPLITRPGPAVPFRG